jgi:hypothetical protein
MNRPVTQTEIRELRGKPGMLVPALVIWAVGIVVAVIFFWTGEGFTESLGRYYLLPWAAMTAVVLLAPSVYLWYKGKFDPFHPLVYGVWIYLLPAFVGGAVILTFDLTDPYYLTFIDNPAYNLPLSLVYVSIGFLGLIAGYFLPVGPFISRIVDKYLPKKEWGRDDIWLPGFFLIMAGIGLNILGFVQGLLGYQRVDEIGVFDSLVVFLATIFSLGYILLWLGVFHSRRHTLVFYLIIAFLVGLIPLRMAFQGNRSSLMVSLIPIGLAYIYSGRKLKLVNAVVFGTGLVLAVSIGIVYGTTFRSIKGSEARMSAGDYAGQVGATVEYLSRTDPGVIFTQAAGALAERVENLSSLAVVVSNYEKLESYEESYGIKNNIVNEFTTSFIPRFLWPDKPTVSDARAYSDLYFNFGENSFAITVFGDLIRNFGVIGIPLGMLLLGVYLRVIYQVLIDTPEPRIWKKAAYFPLLIMAHYEGFYSSIFPNTIRVLLVIAAALLIANLFTRKRGVPGLSPLAG